MRETIEADFRIVTPMFLGGAKQDVTDGIRPPSIKGALRFWWRALQWGRIAQEASDANKLKALHREEARLFGLAASEDAGRRVGGQGYFLLSVSQRLLKSTKKGAVHRGFSRRDAARYLGYGLMVAFSSAKQNKQAGQLERDCLNEEQTFTVRLRFRATAEPSVLDALKALGLLGGLGNRARHGMGSLALERLRLDGNEIWTAPQNAEGFAKKIRALIPASALPVREPPFTAFWEKARIDLLASEKDPFDVLSQFGRAMLMYRSWGNKGSVLGQASEHRFKDDHDWFRIPGWRTANPGFHPERIAFGLPQNYHQSTQHHVTPEHHQRRTSPLLFHVHPVGTGFIGVGIHLPAKFLPDGERISAGGTPVPANIDWSVITHFLDGKVGNPPSPRAPARFPDKKALLP